MAKFCGISLTNCIKFVRDGLASMQNADSKNHDVVMLEHWEKVTRYDLNEKEWKCPMCKKWFRRHELDGAHVVFPDERNAPQYITPMCQGCNRGNAKTPFLVNVDYLVPAP